MSLTNGLLSIFFPTPCAGCGRYIKDFEYLHVCPECYATMKPHEGRACPQCAKPIHSEHADECRECRERKNRFSFVRPAGVYKGPLKELIHYMKFNDKKSIAKIVAGLMMEKAGDDVFEGVDFLVPVPMSRESALSRGYNQTAVVAGFISKQKTIPVLEAVKKVKETTPQNKLDRKDRMKNLKGAFEVSADVKDKRLLVVDDVFTTGATINEMAKVLMKAGAMEVRGVVAARSI